MAVSVVIVWLALPVRVMVVPLIKLTRWPNREAPAKRVLGTLLTVTKLLVVELAVTETLPPATTGWAVTPSRFPK